MSASQLAWPSGRQIVPGSGAMASQFPLFQLNDADVRSGSVKVIAKAPSGQVRGLNIQQDATGQYKTDFTPNEVGDWTISLLYNDQHIQGSPFNVRVQDPSKVRVYGLNDTESIGREVSFSVDTTGAGEGELTVEVLYLGRVIGTRLAQQGNTYQAAFLPEGTGQYNVYVFFARMDVPGSPFIVNIANPGIVSAFGEGLTSGNVGFKSLFVVDTSQDSSSDDITVRIKTSKGSILPVSITPVGAGVFNVEYIPNQVGDYTIEVLFHDKAVNGSPFACKISDPSQIIVSNLPGTSVAGKPIEFLIDAKESGPGKVQILINDGNVPCNVESIGNRRYRASFKPEQAVRHVVQILFNDSEVNGSPWILDVVSADNVHTTVDQLPLLPINRPATFEVHTVVDGTVQVKITSSTQKVVPTCITKQSVGTYIVEFTPVEIGRHNVAVTYEGLAVSSGASVCLAYNAAAITVSNIPTVAAGETVEFTVNTSDAGPGDLTIVVNEGQTPSAARVSGPNEYTVSFKPILPGFYTVELFFNNQPLKDSPVVVPVVNASLVTLQCNSNLIPVGKLAVLRANTQDAGPAKLTAKVLSPSCRYLVVQVTGSDASGFDVEFTPTEPGPHELKIEYGGQSIPVSPFVMMAFDVSRIKVLGVKDSLVGFPGSFVVDLNKCGEGELDVCVLSAGGHPIVNEIKPLEPGRLDISFVPTEPGSHFAEITFNGEHVQGSPFKFNVRDTSNVVTRGDGLTTAECNKSASFVIIAPDALEKDIDIVITAPNGRQILPRITETKPYNFLVDYTPPAAGAYIVDIHYHGRDIPGSPFTVQCWDASRVLLTDVKQCEVGNDSFLNIEMVDAGDGTIEISIAGPSGQLIPNEVVTTAPSLLRVHFVPTVSGLHKTTVTFNGLPIPGSPATFNVVDANKITVRGDGLGLVQCGRSAVFVISAPDANLSDLDVSIISPNGKHLIPDVNQTSKGNYRVEYLPAHVGTYEVRIASFGKEMKASPFCAKAWDASRVLVADVAMGQVGLESSFKVIVADAGEGVLEVTMTDPAGHLIANRALPVEPGILEVVFTPKMAGIHRGNVVFNKEKVPGSPFTFLVIDAAIVTCWGDGLNLVPVKKLANFMITAPQAKLQDVNVRIVGPNGVDVLSRVVESGNSSFRVDYTPLLAGSHVVYVLYFGNAVPVCPITVEAWDIGRVLVSPIDLAYVGLQAQFTVNTKDAGQGKLDVILTGPQLQRVQSEIHCDSKHGAYLVSYIATTAGLHRADITYNGEVVPGNPFTFTVADPENATVSGNGIETVRCKKVASFVITSPAAKRADLNVKITGHNHKPIHHRIFESGPGIFTVEYTPLMAGKIDIDIKYFNRPIRGSPFVAQAWDAAGVTLENVRPGVINKLYTFDVNAINAGNGSLEISIQCRGETIPNVAKALGQTGVIEVSFTPKYIDSHQINVRFNGEVVPGSPFIIPILDGSLVTASGPGLGHVIAHKKTSFFVSTNAAGGEADLVVSIKTPSNGHVENLKVKGSASVGHTVKYTPTEPGCHTINVKYADIAIRGSPFSVDVFDPNAVLIIGQIAPLGRLAKPVSIQVDTRYAGRGILTPIVKGPTTQPGVTSTGSAEGLSALSFIPVETGEHLIFLSFNNINIPGSPFLCNVIDPKTLNVNWDAIHRRPIRQPTEVLLRTDISLKDKDITCTVTDPYGRPVLVAHAAKERIHGFMFIGEEVGPHVIDLHYGTEPVPGSPYTCYMYDSQRVKIIDVSPCGNIGDEITFTVDTTEAGMGDVDVEVMQGTVSVPVRRQNLCPEQARFCFIATSPKDHLINVTFNSELIPLSPLVLCIVNPASKMSLSNGNGTRFVQTGQTVWAVVCPPGFPILPQDILGTVTAPTGERLPVTLTQQSDGSIKLEYRSMFTGPHSLEATYAGQLIPGSPIVTVMFDINKVLIEGTRCSRVGEPIVLDVVRADAGDAELCITVSDPDGHVLPFDVRLNQIGETVTYIPHTCGTHCVNVTFGGVQIPGCPVRQEIVEVPFATVRGSGLELAVVDRQAEFVVDVKGEPGELCVQIQGPNSIANCSVEPETGGLLKVRYVPTEVGVHTAVLDWNGTQVKGTPCFVKVVDPTKVEVANYNEHWLANDHVKVQIGELQTIVFDCRFAGPGVFKATVDGSEGDVGADVLPIDALEYAVKFVPRKEGDYFIRVYWSNLPIDKFPIVATAVVDINPPPPPPPPCIPLPELPVIRADLVSVHGPGLSTARVCDASDFVVDGHEAGPGVLDIELVGLKLNIDVMCVPLNDSVFGCTYVPELAGAYLLSVLWSGQHVPGSPFKVSVVSSSDASKVVCSGDGLTSAVVGRNASVLIDCRRAGSGEIVAQCAGPTKMALCTLIDRHDGTFELVIKPQEVGSHNLDIKYGDEPVPRSPFIVKVTAAPDANKVHVSGAGISNGILATYQSTFKVDTRGAGPGQLTVKVRGPKGAFKVEMMKLPDSDRAIACRYHPTEVGQYHVFVLWSGQHVPGSPFNVTIVDTLDQLEQLRGCYKTSYNNETLRMSTLSGNGLVFNED